MSAAILPSPAKRATIADLYKVEGKAELIGGRIVEFMPIGFRHNRVAGRIFRSLDDYCNNLGKGIAFTDSMGFVVPELLSGRESFSPDASVFFGLPPVVETEFVADAPDFAVEVRSPSDYGPAAEREIAAKRDDYFEAGTKVVWDVDPEADTVSMYRANNPQTAIVFGKGDSAHAEPTVPGWTVEVDPIFRRP